MMREVNFRAWDNKTKKFYSIHAFSVHDDGTTELWSFDVEGGYRLTDYVPEQYSGVTDVGANPIFEGDIVKVYHQGIDEVVFERGCFGLRANNYHSFVPLSELNGAMTVIGNIHEDVDVVGE